MSHGYMNKPQDKCIFLLLISPFFPCRSSFPEDKIYIFRDFGGDPKLLLKKIQQRKSHSKSFLCIWYRCRCPSQAYQLSRRHICILVIKMSNPLALLWKKLEGMGSSQSSIRKQFETGFQLPLDYLSAKHTGYLWKWFRWISPEVKVCIQL